jgi:AbiV family abortive infection protein
MDEVVLAIMDNAHRLLMDAKILEGRGRYQSAVSLAILSLEESGKACLVRWKRGGLINRDIFKDLHTGHIFKQRILGTYFFTKAAFDAVFLDTNGQPVIPEDSDAVFERAAKAGYDGSARMMFYAESGALDFMKMAGFYVDLNDKLEVISKGGDIEAGDAARHIRDAETAFEMAGAPERLHRGMAAVYESSKPRKPRRRTRELHEAVWAAIGHANLDDE